MQPVPGTRWWLEVRFNRPFDGLECDVGNVSFNIPAGPRPSIHCVLDELSTVVRVPFDTRQAADAALSEVRLRVVCDNPVVPGEVIREGDDQDDHRVEQRDHAVRPLSPGVAG